MINQLQQKDDSLPVLGIIQELYNKRGFNTDFSYKRKVVPVKDWIRDPYYVGSIAGELYPFWEEVIIEFEETKKNELIITGGLSSGKSFCALVLFLRKVYELSCNPSIVDYLGCAKSSIILFVYLAISVFQARLTGFGKLIKMIDQIPYFTERYGRDKRINSAIKFNSGELAIIAGSEVSHYRGGDLFGLIFDEGNFRKGTDKTKLEGALKIYTESTNRRKTRFINQKEDKSFSIIVSSTDNITSFTEERIKASEDDSSIMVVRASTWQTRPGRYGGKKFWVFKGSEKIDPFIEGNESSYKSYLSVHNLDRCEVKNLPLSLKRDWVEVPEEYRKLFETNIVRALADVAGIAIGSTSRILTNKEAFDKCFSKNNGLFHPFTKEKIIVSYQSPGRVEDYLLKDFFFDPNKKYFVSVDQSLTTDSTGLSITHKERDKDGDLIVVDMMLKIDPPGKPDQISIRKVREFIFYLRENRRMKIEKLTYDWFASQEAIQEAQNYNIDAGRLSVDKDSSQYDLLVDLILRERIKGYYYPPLKEELFTLEKDRTKNKVDHPKGGAKDCSDSLAASVWNSWVYGKVSFDWVRFVG